MTNRLYYLDAHMRQFDATVVSSKPEGERHRVILDRSAFYPTSGGQPFDTGRLGTAAVVEVLEDEQGDVVHITDTPLAAGEQVHGVVDWSRRFDHMQQHSGQHVLSAICAVRLGAATASVHFGAETSTIDLQPEIAPAAIAEAELEANRIVWENRDVRVRFVSAEEADRLPLRKPPAKTGPLRLVEIDGCDLSACGGTHVSATGMIGMIAIGDVERFKGGTRVAFVCGGRALRTHRALLDAVHASSRLLSATPPEVPAAIERLQREAKAAGRSVEGLIRELAGYRAAVFRASAETIGPYRVVLQRVDGPADATGLKTLAAAVTESPGVVAVLVSGGDPSTLVVSRSADVRLDAAALVRDAIAACGGRGGGRPEAAQAGLAAGANRVLAILRDLLGGQ
jgi:alanyl-tRNA synthetase